MQILGLLGMYFDAVVVEVKTFLLLLRLALAILCDSYFWNKFHVKINPILVIRDQFEMSFIKIH